MKKWPKTVDLADARETRSAKSFWSFLRDQFGNSPELTTITYLVTGKGEWCRAQRQDVSGWADSLGDTLEGKRTLARYANRVIAVLGYTEDNPEAVWGQMSRYNPRVQYWVRKLEERVTNGG